MSPLWPWIAWAALGGWGITLWLWHRSLDRLIKMVKIVLDKGILDSYNRDLEHGKSTPPLEDS